MQIVCSKSVSKFAEPLLSSLKYIGQDCTIWSSETKPINDMVEDLRPNVLIIAPNESNEMVLAAQQQHNFQLVYFGFGQFFIEPNLWCLPENTPIDIFNGIPNAHTFKKCADLAKYGKGTYQDDYNYDVVYLSDMTYDNIEIRDTLIELSTKDLSFIIVGNASIPLPQYLGSINLKERANLIWSCKVGIDFNLLNAFNFAIYKKPCVCVTGGAAIGLINKYLNSPALRKEHGEAAYKYVVGNNLTGFDESSNLLLKLGHSELSEQCLSAKTNLLALW